MKERLLDLLSNLWGWLSGILLWGPLYCLPVALWLFGFTRHALLGYIILMAITGIYFLYALICFIFARIDENVDRMNRCLWVWVTFGGAAVIGTIAAKLAGIFNI